MKERKKERSATTNKCLQYTNTEVHNTDKERILKNMYQEHIFPNFIKYILVTLHVTHSKWRCV